MKDLGTAYLMDFYGNLLSDKQRDIMQMYYQEDLSLSEVAAECGITRQGVRDNIVRAQKELEGFESALGLCAKFSSINERLDKIKKMLSDGGELTAERRDAAIALLDSVQNDI